MDDGSAAVTTETDDTDTVTNLALVVLEELGFSVNELKGIMLNN